MLGKEDDLIRILHYCIAFIFLSTESGFLQWNLPLKYIAAENVLVTREFYPDKTLAELYDPDKMPQDLREAHATLDDIVESCYPGYPFATDEARLECLFKLYEKMTKK